MNTIREKFMRDGIMYDELDVELIDILNFLNFEVGLKTKYCCFGHDEKDQFYIMFHEEVEYSKLEDFAVQVTSAISAKDITFKYWLRGSAKGTIKNWVCETNGRKSIEKRFEILDAIKKVCAS